MKLLNLPKHENPAAERASSAPYNFIPLPEVVVPAVANACDLPDHDTYANPRYPHSGYFDVTLTTRSPIYVRGTLSTHRPDDSTPSEFERAEAEQSGQGPASFRQMIKNKPDFFSTHDPSQPIIPGSTLRGMLRGLLEIVSYGKVQWVTDKKLFYRTVDNTALGQHYNELMVEKLGPVRVLPHASALGFRSRVRGGFFRVRSNGTYFIEECVVARVEVNHLVVAFGLTRARELYDIDGASVAPGDERNPNQTPKWTYQHRDIWVDVGPEENHFFPQQFRSNGSLRHPDLYLRYRQALKPTLSEDQGKAKGTLVLTGHMEQKHLAFVFIPTSQIDPAAEKRIEVPNDPNEEDTNRRLVDRFHDEDQLTRWQARAFPDNQPSGARRGRDGYLRDGEPVFFLTDKGGAGDRIVFFGRAQMFRLPYDKRPIDLVPDELRRPEQIDFSEAMFGFVRSRQELDSLRQRNLPVPTPGTKGRAYAGRVFVMDAALAPGQGNVYLVENGIVPKILGTPKPTAFQHYLVQTHDDRRKLKYYDCDDTTIRGQKLYWHQGRRTIGDIRETDPQWLGPDGEVRDSSTQHTQFKPIKAGVKFEFRLYFENLSHEELGALCWVLHPVGDEDKDYCHSLRMGKPLGMGAVKLDATLYLTDRKKRYQSLFDANADQCRWQTGLVSPKGRSLSDRSDLEELTRPFEQHVLRALGCAKDAPRLSRLKRIAMLLEMLEWQEWVPSERAIQLTVGKFRDRPVLPDPIYYSASNPKWKTVVEPPCPAGSKTTTSAGSATSAAAEGMLTPQPGGLALPAVQSETADPKARPAEEGRVRLDQSGTTVARPSQPAAAPSRRELVMVLDDAKGGSALVQTGQGEQVICTGFSYPPPRAGKNCRADVFREQGRAIRAVFKGWV